MMILKKMMFLTSASFLMLAPLIGEEVADIGSYGSNSSNRTNPNYNPNQSNNYSNPNNKNPNSNYNNQGSNYGNPNSNYPNPNANPNTSTSTQTSTYTKSTSQWSSSQNSMPPQNQAQARIMWYTNYNQALSVAKRENRPLLLFFTGSDWCGWCKKIDKEVFENPEFASHIGNRFIFVKLDFPMNNPLPKDESNQNAMLKQKYGITGFPTVVVIDSNENFIAESGYRPGGGKEYANYLLSLVQR